MGKKFARGGEGGGEVPGKIAYKNEIPHPLIKESGAFAMFSIGDAPYGADLAEEVLSASNFLRAEAVRMHGCNNRCY